MIVACNRVQGGQACARSWGGSPREEEEEAANPGGVCCGFYLITLITAVADIVNFVRLLDVYLNSLCSERTRYQYFCTGMRELTPDGFTMGFVALNCFIILS